MSKSSVMFRLADKYFHPDLDLRAQSFNLLAFAGITAGITAAIIAHIAKAGSASVVLCLAASSVGVFVLRVAGKKFSYRVCCWITIIVVFMLAFPVLFFVSGGYRSGMPCFFVFAIIYTAIMLEKRERVAALVIQFILYVGCCLAAYFFPEIVRDIEKESYYVTDVTASFMLSGILLSLVVLQHLRMYNLRQVQIKELNRELEARNETLTRYDKMKSDFLATVAHEISKPLVVISASSADTMELLKESPAAMEEIIENHKRIEQKVMLIDGIVTDLMDTVAIENGRLSLSRRPVKLSELLKNVCDTWFKQLNSNNNRIAYDFQPRLPRIWADPMRIEQVMTNLISNAVKATDNGVITIKLTRTDKSQLVSVSDNGEGMDEEIAKIVLKQYVSSKRDYWRHGIGLYICRQIITAHGGEIWIESEKGRGTTISFSLREEPGYE